MSPESLRFLLEIRNPREWAEIRNDDRSFYNARDSQSRDDGGPHDVYDRAYDGDPRGAYDGDPHGVYDLHDACDHAYDRVPHDAYASHDDDDVRDDRDDVYHHVCDPLYARDGGNGDDPRDDHDDAPRDDHAYDDARDDAYDPPCARACGALYARVRDDDDDFRFPCECDGDDVR